jgi:hypothetical protein
MEGNAGHTGMKKNYLKENIYDPLKENGYSE